MDTMISLNDAFMLGLIFLGMIALIALIIVLIKLTKTLKKVDGVLDDVNVITTTAKDKVIKIDEVMDDVTETTTSLLTSMKESQGMIKTLGSVAKACSNVATYVKGSKKDN